MNVYLGLTTRGNTMKQGDIMLQERHKYLVVGCLLCIGKLLYAFQMGLADTVKTTYLSFVGNEETAGNEGLYHLCTTTTGIHQLVAGYLADTVEDILFGHFVGDLVPMR